MRGRWDGFWAEGSLRKDLRRERRMEWWVDAENGREGCVGEVR